MYSLLLNIFVRAKTHETMKTTKITDESFCQLLFQSITCRKETCLFKNILPALKDVVRCLYYLKTVVNIIITQFLFHVMILARCIILRLASLI